MKMLHLAANTVNTRLWLPSFVEEIQKIGDLEIIEQAETMSADECAQLIRQAQVLMTGWGSALVPPAVARDPGELQYVCNVTGTVRPAVPVEIIDAGIKLTNWGDAPAGRLAEAAFTLLLACVKNLRQRIEWIAEGEWGAPEGMQSLMLEDIEVGVFGCGVIGRRFVEMLGPFGCRVRVYDPYVDSIPDGCERVESLDELFEKSQAVALHAGLSDETRGVISAELLSKLPEGGIVINTARGGIIDQAALFTELRKGRLIAGLDVLEPDVLKGEHEAKRWPNLILTAHDMGKTRYVGNAQPGMEAYHRICLDNLRRFKNGETLRFEMDRVRYERST